MLISIDTPQLDKVQKHKGLKNAQPEMEHTLPPKDDGVSVEKEVKRVSVGGRGGLQGSSVFWTQQGRAHMNSRWL